MASAFAGTLHIRVRVSSTYRWWVLGAHILATGVVLLLAWHRPMLLALLPLLAGSAYAGLRQVGLNARKSLRRLRWPIEGNLRWQSADGAWHEGQLCDAFVAGTWLVILTLRADGQRWRRTRCLLFRDALSATAHRQLRARLTVMPPMLSSVALWLWRH